MPRNEHEVEIARPATTIFPYLSASEARLRWMGALTSSEQVSEGPPALGTRFRDVFEDAGQRIEIDAEIVEWAPPERLVLRLESKQFESTVRQSLAEADGRTRVATVIDTTYTSRLARMMSGVVTRHAQKRLEEDLRRLKDTVEAATG